MPRQHQAATQRVECTPVQQRTRHAGTRPKQRYDRWDRPRECQRSPGRHCDKSWDQSRPHESQWERLWNQPSSFGNSREKSSWDFNGNSKGKLTLEQPAQGIDERIHKDSKLTELKLNPHKNKRPHHISNSLRLIERMMKEFFQRKEADRSGKRKRNQLQPD